MKTNITALFAIMVLCGLSAAQLPLRFETTGTQVFQGYAAAIARIADRDNDGVADLLVGSPDAGRVDLVSGASGQHLGAITSPLPFEGFGSALAALDDLDNDGVDDFAVGAPLHDDSGGDQGRVLFYSGATLALLFDVKGDHAGDELGSSILRWQDLDGDGCDEFVIGAPGTAGTGYVRLYRANGQPLSTFWGSTIGGGTGAALARLPDLDGDGLDELAIGSPWADFAGVLACGRLQVVAGNGLTLLIDLGGSSTGAGFGSTAAAIADLNNDGAADLLVGAPGDDQAGPDVGSVSLISGSNGQIIRSHSGQQPFGLFGNAVAAIGDADGDGQSDYAIGAWFEDGTAVDSGALRVFSGATGAMVLERRNASAGAQLGRALCGLGDSNGDGFTEIAVGLPRSSAGPILSGALRVYSVGGYAEFGVNSGSVPSSMSLSFLPQNQNLANATATAAQGTLFIDGAGSYSPGLIAVSLATAVIDIGVLTVLLNPDPSLLFLQHNFGYDLQGQMTFPVTTSHPFLAGVSVYIQAYDLAFPYGATQGLEMHCLP